MRLRRIVTAATAVVGLLLAGATTATADGPERAQRGRSPVYVALGDSVAAGFGQPTRATSYVGLLSRDLRRTLDCSPWGHRGRDGCRDLRLVDLSVNGATTATLIADQLPAAAALIGERNTDRRRRNDVEVVTITIGGNDVFGPVVSACILGQTDCPATVARVLATYQTNLTRILAGLRAAGGPKMTIATTAYYNPLPSCFLAPFAGLADVVLEGGTLPGLGTLAGGLNDITRAVSTAYGAEVADAYGRLGVADLLGGADCLHPDASGHEVLADIFATAIDGARESDEHGRHR